MNWTLFSIFNKRRALKRFFGILDFPYLKLVIRDFPYLKLGIRDFPNVKLGTRDFLYLKLRIRDFPFLKLGIRIFLFETRDSGFSLWKLEIRDFKARSGLDSWLKVCAAGVMPKITIGFTGLHEILGRDYGIEEPYWGPSKRRENHAYSKLIFFLFLTAVFSWWRFGEAQEAFIVIQSSSYIQSKNAGIPGKLFWFVSSIF